MPKWTLEQESAINESGKNIIVSAGAGSGKTAVLTERVIRKLKSGISIKNLLILTFTNNAAHEMKDRIRTAIKNESVNNSVLKKELDYIDNAYITTFDSFSLSIVKKYHYLLGISNNISIVDSSIIDLKREEELDNIFEDMYISNDELFFKLIDLLCVKNDDEVKKYILDINKKLDLLSNKNEFINKYIDNYFSDSFIDNILEDYTNLLLKKIDNIKLLFNSLCNEIEGKYEEEYYKLLSPLFNSKSYNDIKLNNITSLGQLRNSTELGKKLKADIISLLKEIDSLTKYEYSDIRSNIVSTKEYIIPILNIIKELDIRIKNYKKSINKYEFNDISIMAINVVRDNISVLEELKYSFNEICVDEYQDTSDLQEDFINLISNNNVYMVGDIKQSIYRFRNANPILFKNKYDNYSNNNGGMKIDLNKNFRSRNEVLDDINILFNLIMDNDIGGAEYRDSHNMIFGNIDYNIKCSTKQNNNLEVYNYTYEKGYPYNKEEIEAFIIAKDILNKINSNYQVMDKKTTTLRNVNYNDFVILMDRSSYFDLYKKIFEYMGIPTTLLKDDNIVNEDELYIIKNIICLIIKIYNKEYDTEFKYLFTSILRSYVIGLSDNDILKIFKDNSFINTELYNKLYNISNDLDNMNNTLLFERIINDFSLYDKFISVGNISGKSTIISYLYKTLSDLDSIGCGVFDIKDYFNNIIEKNKEIKIDMNTNTDNSVKIMTIHKSKGLEYNICYFSGFYRAFNLGDLKEKILYDNKYGIITPIYKEGLSNVVTKELVKYNYIKDDISERIRLLYVALTRAREKMIIVGDFSSGNENESDVKYNGVINDITRSGYRSFNDIILSIKKYIINNFVQIDLDSINLTHEYNLIKQFNYDSVINKSDKIISTNSISVDNSLVINKHFSKSNKSYITKDIRNIMDFGIRMHEVFEICDFKNPDLSYLSDNDKKCLNNFLNLDLFKNINNGSIYKEYEFMYTKDNIKYHGIIDLMIVYSDHIDIIDYKLSNTDSIEYIDQLNGYKDYISNLFNRSVNLYLYSIIKNELKNI